MSLLELADNLLQLLMLSALLAASIEVVAQTANNNPAAHALQYFICALVCCLAGNVFWVAYFWLCDDFPYYFSPAEIGYLGFYLALVGLCAHLVRLHKLRQVVHHIRWYIWCLPLGILLAHTTCYVLVGHICWNIYYAVPLIILGYHAAYGLQLLRYHPKQRNLRLFYRALVWYLIFSNAMFVVSCFDANNLYLLLDITAALGIPCMFYALYAQVSAVKSES